MNENLIAGYAAYTTADEYGASATGDAPASVETITITIASAAASASVAATWQGGC
ncbi:LxmA leader domain family RiPP [Streptomyces sp. NPDC057623]|uniref:LxmA leader domain family RiPP n=1 Tax=Streptomyces sp. NPDC057623 TaxID=3346187 RepID=UPI0036A7E02C